MNKISTDKDLIEAIVSWPKGSNGYVLESQIVILLNKLCKEHGYGRIPQMASIIQDIWNNPEELSKYKKQMRDHLALMESYRKELLKNKNEE